MKFDQPFLSKVYRVSFAFILVALLLSLQMGNLRVSGGLAAGYALAAFVLFFWQAVIGLAMNPDKPRPALAGVALLVKMPLLAAAVWVLMSKGWVNPAALAIGFLIPQLTMAVLALGRRVMAPGAPLTTTSSTKQETERVATRA
ncbi:MAG: hypothetical protein ACYS22_03555 [Planctomycetota bacterium]|jgi:hypothetical protein